MSFILKSIFEITLIYIYINSIENHIKGTGSLKMYFSIISIFIIESISLFNDNDFLSKLFLFSVVILIITRTFYISIKGKVLNETFTDALTEIENFRVQIVKGDFEMNMLDRFVNEHENTNVTIEYEIVSNKVNIELIAFKKYKESSALNYKKVK